MISPRDRLMLAAMTALREWTPTHTHADGGEYRMVSECHIHTGISEWTDGVIYESKHGSVYVRPAGEFANRFQPLQVDSGDAKDVSSGEVA